LPGDACEAFCTDVKGKIVAQVFVLARSDRFDLLTAPKQAISLIAHLDRYVIREDVQLTDVTSDGAWMFVGVAAGELPIRTAAELESTPSDFCGLPGFLLRVADHELQKVKEQLINAGGKVCGWEAWEARRIEAGLPLFDVDFDSSQLPQEINRDALAINFNKGCYLGQETIARIDALGHVNQKVVLLKFARETLPPVGTELNAAGKVVGKITSRCWSPRLEAPLALAMVRRGSNTLGSQLESKLGSATVVAPPVKFE